MKGRQIHAYDKEPETLGEAVPNLVKALVDKDEVVRGMSAEALEQLGAEAVPELKKAAAGDDKKVTAAAAELLKHIGRG